MGNHGFIQSQHMLIRSVIVVTQCADMLDFLFSIEMYLQLQPGNWSRVTMLTRFFSQLSEI